MQLQTSLCTAAAQQFDMTTRILFVRHGETSDNTNNVNGGQNDTPLNDQGREQAKRAATYLQDEQIDVFFVSDLPRTRETAMPISRNHPSAKIIYEPRIRELNFGRLEGSPHGSVAREAENAGIPFVEYRPERGESVLDLRKRVFAFIEEIIVTQQGKTVAIISHGGPITNMILHLLKIEPTHENFRAHHPHNTAITIIETNEKGKSTLHKLNTTEHLS